MGLAKPALLGMFRPGSPITTAMNLLARPATPWRDARLTAWTATGRQPDDHRRFNPRTARGRSARPLSHGWLVSGSAYRRQRARTGQPATGRGLADVALAGVAASEHRRSRPAAGHRSGSRRRGGICHHARCSRAMHWGVPGAGDVFFRCGYTDSRSDGPAHVSGRCSHRRCSTSPSSSRRRHNTLVGMAWLT